jgi:alpha-methylacyl-CoA racemase
MNWQAGPLSDVRVLEFESAGPVPFCGMGLADLGAEVTVIGRPDVAEGPLSVAPEHDLMRRGKALVQFDLKQPESVKAVEELASSVDVLLEGYRPGTMERLGLGPVDLMRRNPRLIYCRISGYGQHGPMARVAGHDLNFLAESGALYYMGPGIGVPLPPLNLIADFGGGGMLALVRVLAAIREVDKSGAGQCIDVSMIEGCQLLMASVASLMRAGKWAGRGSNIMDGSCPWYCAYLTADQGMVVVASIEPKYYEALVITMNLNEHLESQFDRSKWAALRAALQIRFQGNTLSHWRETFSEVEACVSPVLAVPHTDLAAARFRQAIAP